MPACTDSGFTNHTGSLTLVSCPHTLIAHFLYIRWVSHSACSVLYYPARNGGCYKAHGAHVCCICAANIAIFIHLLGAFQVWMQPLYGEQPPMICSRIPSRECLTLQACRGAGKSHWSQGSACTLRLCWCLAQALWRCLCTRGSRGRHGCSMTSLPPRSEQGQALHVVLSWRCCFDSNSILVISQHIMGSWLPTRAYALRCVQSVMIITWRTGSRPGHCPLVSFQAGLALRHCCHHHREPQSLHLDVTSSTGLRRSAGSLALPMSSRTLTTSTVRNAVPGVWSAWAVVP